MCQLNSQDPELFWESEAVNLLGKHEIQGGIKLQICYNLAHLLVWIKLENMCPLITPTVQKIVWGNYGTCPVIPRYMSQIYPKPRGKNGTLFFQFLPETKGNTLQATVGYSRRKGYNLIRTSCWLRGCWRESVRNGNGLSQKKSNQEGLRTWNFRGSWGNSRCQLKKKWKFQGCSRKTNVEFPWVSVFDFGISKGCHTNSQNFQG